MATKKETTKKKEKTTIDTKVVNTPQQEMPVTPVEEVKENFVEAAQELQDVVENLRKEDNVESTEETIEELKEQVDELMNNKEVLNDTILSNPDLAKETIKKEMKKVEELKNKVGCALKRVTNFTEYWNGQTYDF